MLSLTFLFISLVLSFAAAQSNTTFDPTSVDLTEKNQWCQGETANCPTLCGGQTQTKANSCTGSSLEFTCTCANGTGPSNIAAYQGTLPNFICEATFAQCRIANPGSEACKTCGTLMPSDVQAIASSTSSAAATSSTGTATMTSASTTASSKSKSGAGRIEAAGGVIGGAIGLAAVLL
ncbi:hypothetical protein HO173_002968 [Letharia columbiana]|uniref:DUF7707 domain-containing protein n=1 Tax=Letharia columbiana TaxID=112416 RepID=A0A8H6G217_9LECA|nr:uncharacterized protein HO173_002968 [Letharia columbiana]KAF6239096.1 hypothetical protein HO173_002968 [Letharia columbiana]